MNSDLVIIHREMTDQLQVLDVVVNKPFTDTYGRTIVTGELMETMH